MSKTGTAAGFCALVVLFGLALCAGCRTEHPQVQQPDPGGVFHVSGAVLKPGDIPCSPGETKTLMELLAATGGVTDEAIRTRVLVIHDGITTSYNLKSIVSGALADPAVPCGSAIHVKKRISL